MLNDICRVELDFFYTDEEFLSIFLQVPVPTSKPNWTALISPFEYPVWLGVSITYCLVGVFLYWHIRLTNEEKQVTPSEIMTWIVGELTDASGKSSWHCC